jgi:hypothetical protein
MSRHVQIDDNNEDFDPVVYQRHVLFRLSNKPNGSSCFRPAYVALDDFTPDAESLSSLQVFDKVVNATDFRLIVGVVNATLRPYRKAAFAVTIAATILTFAAVAVMVFHLIGGITMQLLVFLSYAILQALFRYRGVKLVNSRLEQHVNRQLEAHRKVAVAFHITHGNASCNHCAEIDFVFVGKINEMNPLAVDPEAVEQAQEQAQSLRVERPLWQEDGTGTQQGHSDGVTSLSTSMQNKGSLRLPRPSSVDLTLSVRTVDN